MCIFFSEHSLSQNIPLLMPTSTATKMYIKIHYQLTMLSCNNRYFQLLASVWVHFTTLPAQNFACFCNFIHMHPLLHFHHAPINQTRWTPRVLYLWNPKNHLPSIFIFFLQKKYNFFAALMLPPSKNSWYYRVLSYVGKLYKGVDFEFCIVPT